MGKNRKFLFSMRQCQMATSLGACCFASFFCRMYACRFVTISADLPDYPEDHLDATAGVLHAQAPSPSPSVASMPDMVSLSLEP